MNMDDKGNSDPFEQDPAEYLLSNSKYHNCHIMVGDPACDQVERIGVVRSILVAHSSVFREVWEDSELADPTEENTYILNVTPEIFKLMLRHVYGGQLPDMSPETAAQLVTCADKYNIRHLVRRASQRLTPTTYQSLTSTELCITRENRPSTKVTVKTENPGAVTKSVSPVVNKPTLFNIGSFISSTYTGSFFGKLVMLDDNKHSSNLTIKTYCYELELHSITCKSVALQVKHGEPVYYFECGISFYFFTNGFVTNREFITFKGIAVYGEDIVIPLKLTNGEFVRLKPNSKCNVKISFNTNQPVFITMLSNSDTTKMKRFVHGVMDVQFNTPQHVQKINFMY